MSLTGISGAGRIRLFDDFCGHEIPVANAVAYGGSAGGCNYYVGPFKLLGDLVNTDTGAAAQSKASGYIRLASSAAADADGCALATEVCFSPALNGPIVMETRLEMAALTARHVFFGLMGTAADNIAEATTNTTITITKAVPCLGFLFDSQLTTSGTNWFMPYILASDTTQTSTDVVSSQTAVLAESDVLRLEVDRDGGARWYINGKLEQTVGAGLAATTTTLMAAVLGVWSTTTTLTSLDVDYMAVEAERDWTR